MDRFHDSKATPTKRTGEKIIVTLFIPERI